ncbi:MAG: LAGLIDADG family homing endonuclease [Anaerolineae bacterium]
METKVAWLAGFVDGEGCITILKQTRQGYVGYTAAIIAVNTHEPTIRYIQETFGGRVYHVKGTGRARPRWQWQKVGNQAVDLAKLLEPYLVTKKRAAEILALFPPVELHGPVSRHHPNFVTVQAERERLFKLIREEAGPSLLRRYHDSIK